MRHLQLLDDDGSVLWQRDLEQWSLLLVEPRGQLAWWQQDTLDCLTGALERLRLTLHKLEVYGRGE